MATLESLRRQEEGAEDLESIVAAMKSISAVRIRQFRAAVEALEEYGTTLELAFQVALRARRRLPVTEVSDDAAQVAIVFGADQGLAGQFNVRVLEFAAAHLPVLSRGARRGDGSRRGPTHIFAVGERVASILGSREIAVAERFPVPGSVDGVGPVVQDLILACRAWREDQGIERFTLFYNDYRGGASYEPVRRALLPLDPEWFEELRDRPWAGPSLPDYRPHWPELFRSLVREQLYITLYRACAESVASENASRLSAMESAETRIDERLSKIRGRLNRQRQQVITEELLEVVSGFQVLEEERARSKGEPPF